MAEVELFYVWVTTTLLHSKFMLSLCACRRLQPELVQWLHVHVVTIFCWELLTIALRLVLNPLNLAPTHGGTIQCSCMVKSKGTNYTWIWKQSNSGSVPLFTRLDRVHRWQVWCRTRKNSGVPIAHKNKGNRLHAECSKSRCDVRIQCLHSLLTRTNCRNPITYRVPIVHNCEYCMRNLRMLCHYSRWYL